MKNYHFEKSQSVVQLRENGGIYVQSIDQYGYQRELTITRVQSIYEIHTYLHPIGRNIVNVNKLKGGKMIARICEICEKWPGLLFNETTIDQNSYVTPRNRGFVQLHTRLLMGNWENLTIEELLG